MLPGRPQRLLALLLALMTIGCGGGGDALPFDIPTPTPAGTPPPSGGTTPPPTPPPANAWQPDAFAHQRTAAFGSFPSSLTRLGATLFATDADVVDAGGAQIVPLDSTRNPPVLDARFRTTLVVPASLRDSNGDPFDPATPIGFGAFVNEVIVVSETLGFALVNAGGSDSLPTLSNLVVFNPTLGTLRQVVDLARTYEGGGPLFDSTGAGIPGDAFVQSGAEGLEYVDLGPAGARLYVAMTNLVFAAPSNGSTKYPGTLQVFDVDPAQAAPVSPRADPILSTQTLRTQGFNPVALQLIRTVSDGTPRLLATVAGTTGLNASFQTVPLTSATVEAFDAASGVLEGVFQLGLVGLSGIRPAIGQDAAGHHVGYFPSSVTGEVYLLQLDGLFTPFVDVTRLSVLRGPLNGIPITAAQSGGPGGNLTGIGLSPDGRTLVVSGFGDLFAFPQPIPGQLFLLSLPEDVVTGSGFGTDFVPGATTFASVPGRTLGELIVLPGPSTVADVFVNVGGALDPASFVGTSPASLGTLDTAGQIR